MAENGGASTATGRSVTIIGAGIIGASIAYHLARQGQKSVVLEQCAIACAASGKSGGFLAKDWCDSSAVKRLARPSFEMHREFGGGHEVGYRAVQSFSLSLCSVNANNAGLQRERSLGSELAWLDGEAKFVSRGRRIGTVHTNAQVLPKQLTCALLDEARGLCGSVVEYGRVEDVKWVDDAWELTVRGDETVRRMRSEVVVLAMGPWSVNALKWFPQLPTIMAHKAASIVVRAELPATALFTEYVNARGQVREPEMYAREGEVYLCQSAVPEDLPDDPERIQIHNSDYADLSEFARGLSAKLAGAMQREQVVGQACNLPISPDGLPVIGAIPDVEGAYVATGHSCWGILNSPMTGKAVADMILGRESEIDMSPFCPSRFG